MVMGEQLEFPITLSFVADASQGLVYEAVVVEALNVEGQTDTPSAIRPSGVQSKLVVRLPSYKSAWSSATGYTAGDVISYGTVYYELIAGVNRSSNTTPDQDPYWRVTTLNKIYVQFPDSLGANYTVQPTVGSPVYGFFELRVTEVTAGFAHTWKPVRGVIEMLFSPTAVVPDA
jgi:hypothetical protein